MFTREKKTSYVIYPSNKKKIEWLGEEENCARPKKNKMAVQQDGSKTICQLFLLNKNTSWNYLYYIRIFETKLRGTKCLLLLKRNGFLKLYNWFQIIRIRLEYSMTWCKLLVLDRNTWNSITVCKLMIIIK